MAEEHEKEPRSERDPFARSRSYGRKASSTSRLGRGMGRRDETIVRCSRGERSRVPTRSFLRWMDGHPRTVFLFRYFIEVDPNKNEKAKVFVGRTRRTSGFSFRRTIRKPLEVGSRSPPRGFVRLRTIPKRSIRISCNEEHPFSSRETQRTRALSLSSTPSSEHVYLRVPVSFSYVLDRFRFWSTLSISIRSDGMEHPSPSNPCSGR